MARASLPPHVYTCILRAEEEVYTCRIKRIRTMMQTRAPARRRNAAETRRAILASARKAFARAGYDGVGVREIAAGAGVTAMLVNRYFGSKENLFAEVAADTMRDPVILSAENLAQSDLAAALARSLVEVTTPGATPLDGFLILLHSASSPRA